MGRPRKVVNSTVLDNAEETVRQLEADAPDGIRIIGLDKGCEETPNITGGMTREEREEQAFGPKWLVVVQENDLPYAKDIQVVSMNCRAGSYMKKFRCNTEVVLPEAAIRQLEETCIVNERRIDIMPGKSLATVEAMNPGQTIVERDGDFYLINKQPRFSVQRKKRMQESLVIA